MLSKNKIKYINSLKRKKFRDYYGLFVAEGTKVVRDIHGSGLEAELLVCTDEWLKNNNDITAKELIGGCSREQMKKLSSLTTPGGVIAVYRKILHDAVLIPEGELILYLDEIQDPGNIGTIIRTADWYGVKHIYCSEGCADVYSPKVVQATMGAVARVTVIYREPDNFFTALPKGKWIYGMMLDGDNIYDATLCQDAVIVLGNEGNGISPEVNGYLDERFLLPFYPPGQQTMESLNVAVAGAVVLSEFRRRVLKA